MPDHPHLEHPAVVAAQALWESHIADCEQCQQAPGPAPHGVHEEDHHLYACVQGAELHDLAVREAVAAYRAVQG